jgi:hypothetical protein
MLKNNSARRENIFNLCLIALMLIVAFGCICGRDDNGRRRSAPLGLDSGSDGNGGGLTAQANKKTSKKADTRADNNKKSPSGGTGAFQVEYVDVQNPKYQKINDTMREEKVLESAAKDLNRNLSLPYDITLVTRDCGEINAFYNPKDHSISMCYEIMDFYYALFKKAGMSDREASTKMFDTMQFIFLHELGHALIDAYQLPVTGNEEDAADKVSSYINLKELGESGSRAAIAAADAFNLQSQLQGGKDLPFYDEHLLDQQRFYNILCQLYGSNPEKYAILVTKKLLPEQRAVRCPNEFQQNVRTWNTLFEKYRKQ